MSGVGRLFRRIGLVTALLVLVGSSAVAVATGRSDAPDPNFGIGGRVVVPLPDTFATGRFGPIAPAAGGKFLVAYNAGKHLGPGYHAIERIDADGSPDPTFGEAGSEPVEYEVTALAEDEGGGVVFSDDGMVERLGPDGTPDKAFDERIGYFAGLLSARTIAIDRAGRILVGGHFLPGARANAVEHDAAILRFQPDGSPDPSFGKKGSVYVFTSGDADGGEFGVLPDGSMLMIATSLVHIGAEGEVLPAPKVELAEGTNSVVALPDGGFAVANLAGEFAEPEEGTPGCTVIRYGPGGSPDPAFAQRGVLKDPELAGCHLLALPEGGLLVRGTTESSTGERVPRVIRLTAAGAPVTGFGQGGTATVQFPRDPGGEPPELGGLALGANGEIAVAGGARDAFLSGLGAAGAPDPTFGNAGTAVRSLPLPSTTSVRTVLAEPDGDLLVAATTDSGTTGQHPIWMRFTAAGSLIPAPGGAPYTSVPSVGVDLVGDGRGDLYSIGETQIPSYGPTVTKYTAAGTPVAGFGTEGIVRIAGGMKPSSAAVDRDGGLTVFGSLGTGKGMGAYRLTAAGSPDRTFGHRGLATVRFPGGKNGRTFAGLALPDGGVLLVGRGDERLALAELGPDGHLRRSFGRGGELVCGCGGFAPEAAEVVADHGTFYVLSGWELGRREAASVLVKVTHRGTIARSFGDHGHRRTDVGGPVELLARGRELIAVGRRGFDTTPARLGAFGLDGRPRKDFGTGATVSAGPLRGQELAATLQPDGRLVLVGERPTDGSKPEGEGGSSLELLGLR
jgi:uncharacterized delta-60 repeat protein